MREGRAMLRPEDVLLWQPATNTKARIEKKMFLINQGSLMVFTHHNIFE